MVDETLGPGCWGDPCGDPMSAAWGRAAWAFDIRRGEDGLLLPWPATRAFANCPFDDCPSWLAKCAQHGARHETLSIVPAQVGSAYWRRICWAFASAVVFIGRPKFAHPLEADDDERGLKAGDIVSTQHPTDCAIVAFGVDRAKMVRIWSRVGVIVAPVQADLATLRTGGDLAMSPRTC